MLTTKVFTFIPITSFVFMLLMGVFMDGYVDGDFNMVRNWFFHSVGYLLFHIHRVRLGNVDRVGFLNRNIHRVGHLLHNSVGYVLVHWVVNWVRLVNWHFDRVRNWLLYCVGYFLLDVNMVRFWHMNRVWFVNVYLYCVRYLK